MLNIGNKVFRNLQEQVGYNTKCIKELDEALDGLVIEDHLVVVSDPSGTITEEELAILGGNLAFMYYDSAVYIKVSETLTEITFKKCEVVATEVSSTYYKLGMSKIVVTISTRGYVISTDNVISIYSKSQLDTLLSAKADLASPVFTGDVTIPSLNGQSNPAVKPIYYHGIEMFQDSPHPSSITLTILNNSNTSIDTVAKVKSWAQGLSGNVLIATNGNVWYDGSYYELYGILKKANGNFDLFVLNSTNQKTRYYDVDFDSLYTGVNDNTNKLN